MKLCIVTHRIIKGDGQGRANYEIVSEAIRREYQVTLLASSVAPEIQQSQYVHWIPISVKEIPTELLRNFVFSQRAASWLKNHRQEVDLLQVYGCATSFPADINTVQFVHRGWLQSPAHISKLRRDYYGAYQWVYTVLNSYGEKNAFQAAKVIVAVSEKIRQELLELGINTEKIRTILNGVDIDEFTPGKSDRTTLGLPERVPIAAFTGDIRINRKNLDTVLKALVQVPELHLVVLGSTDGSPYPQMASQLGLDNRVHFLGFRRDVSEILKAVDLFVFPSRYEACTLALLEAMATGLPVVTATSTGGAEIVTPECGVVLPDCENIQGLAQALSQLASDPEQRQHMGKVARTIAEQHTWVSKAKSYVDLFEETIAT